jgi:repressor LexA
MRKITTRQREVLMAILEFTSKHKYSPTIRELAEMVGLKSPSTIYAILRKLKMHGLISWEPSSPRTLRIINREDTREDAS